MDDDRGRDRFRTLRSVCGILRAVAGLVALVALVSIPLAGTTGDGAGMLRGFYVLALAGAFFVQVEIALVLVAIERNTRRPRHRRPPEA